MKRAYYNDSDPDAAAWLQELIRHGEIAAGAVDPRSIRDVTGRDLRHFTQCHFFAGIGGWSLALRLAGWPDDRAVWTASCPCQPFSTAGRRQGIQDERHLWPEFFRLVNVCRPPIIFGEQVASPDGLSWLDGVCADLEGAGYAIGAADLCAAGLNAPHRRQRLYWVAHSGVGGRLQRPLPQRQRNQGQRPADKLGLADGLADSSGDRGPEHVPESRGRPTTTCERSEHSPDHGRMAVPYSGRLAERGEPAQGSGHAHRGLQTDRLGIAQSKGLPIPGAPQLSAAERRKQGRRFEFPEWSNFRAIACRDGNCRRISPQPGDGPLAHGIPMRMGPVLSGLAGLGQRAIQAARHNRVVRLRGYGNAIVPEIAATFIQEAVGAIRS